MQLLASAVPERNGKHAPKPGKDIFSAIFIEVDNGFGVGARGKNMAVGQQFLPQLGIVVDFAIEEYPDAAVLVGDGLMSSGNVNDTQATVAQTNPTGSEDSIVIGSTMTQGGVHGVDFGGGD